MKKFVVFDFESTCDENVENYPNEIIEIGAIMLNDSGEEISRFERFSKPSINQQLSEFCKQLTKIKQEDIDSADNISDVIIDFYNWSENCILVSWGGYDIRQISRDVIRQDITNIVDVNDMKKRHINFKKEYSTIKKIKKQLGVRGALNIEGLKFIGTPHRGIDDSINISRIFTKYLDRF
jgi:inhibitor of KinA sporulation pathway (predicted exonuclease)